MEQLDDVVPALDVGASLALADTADEFRGWLKHSETHERSDVIMPMLDDFAALDEFTGWSRKGLASLLGCQHPDPTAWMSVDLGELRHSQTVVNLIREVVGTSASIDPRQRTESIETLAPSANHDDAIRIARREVCRSAVRLCKELLRRSRGSSYAVSRALADGEILQLVVEDLPGEALLLGYERLSERSRVSAQLEQQLGSLAVVQIDTDAPPATTLEEVRQQVRNGLFPKR